MILDSLLQFTTAGGDSAGSAASAASTNMIDLGVGSATQAAIPGSAAGGGARDIGVGDDPAMKILALVTTAFATITSLQVSIQGAPDNGSGVAGSFTVMASGPVVALAQLVVGARVFDDDMPRPAPNQAMPRFIELLYTVVGTTNATGKLAGYLVLDRHDQVTAAPGVLSGYVPGITIAN